MRIWIWTVWLDIAITAESALMFAAFDVHIYSAGNYEPRTMITMSLRTLVWATIAVIAWRGMMRRLA